MRAFRVIFLNLLKQVHIRYFFVLHFVPIMCLSQAEAIITADFPSGKLPTTQHCHLYLGQKACLSGYTAYYISCLDLLERLQHSRGQGRFKNKLTWFGKLHVLLIDEVGYENLNDDAVATATLDRLLHHAHIISLKGDSYRMKDRMKIRVVDFQYIFREFAI